MKRLIVLLGATGIGKTNLSIELAQALNTVIISADSRQIYKELKIGVASPDDSQLQAVKHYFIGSQSIYDSYNASKYESEVIELLETLFKTHDNVLMVGGSGMYIDAVCNGMDDLPSTNDEVRQNWQQRLETEGLDSLCEILKTVDNEYYNQADLKNPVRVLKALEIYTMTCKPYSSFRTQSVKKRDFEIVKIGLNRDREELYQNINLRVGIMLKDGLIAEAQPFLKDRHLNSLNTVGYKELFDYFEGKHSLERAIELIKQNSRNYAKRQMTWFRKDSQIHWFHPSEKEKILALIG